MIEGISSTYTAMQQAQVMQQAQTSMLANAIESVESQGASVVDMINTSSVNGQSQVFTDPMLGQNVDIYA